MSIRIIPQDELGSSEKRTADYIPPLLFPRLKNLYNRRAERLRELAENNPLGDFLRFNGREVLENFGTVKREVAEKLALEQYEQYDAHRRALEAADDMDELTADVKRLKP